MYCEVAGNRQRRTEVATAPGEYPPGAPANLSRPGPGFAGTAAAPQRELMRAVRRTLAALTDGDHYTVIFENDRARVLEYRDQPGERTTVHRHPDSVLKLHPA